MPHRPSITVISDALTDWGAPGEHYLWGTYEITPRPIWWQRICGRPAAAEFRIRVAALDTALEDHARPRLRSAKRRLRDAAEQWAVPVGGPENTSWDGSGGGMHVSCDYLLERRFATLSFSLEGRTELVDLMVRFLQMAGYVIDTPAPEPGPVLDEEYERAAYIRRFLSRYVTEMFNQIVTDLLALGAQARPPHT